MIRIPNSKFQIPNNYQNSKFKFDNSKFNWKLETGNWKLSNGQSLFEVVVAIGVIAIVIVGIVAAATSTIRNTSYSRNKGLATRYAQEAIEWLRGQRDANWVSFYTNANTPPNIYCLDTLSWGNPNICGSPETITDTILLRQVTFSNIQPAEVRAGVSVSWIDSQGTHQVTTVTVFTDWRSR